MFGSDYAGCPQADHLDFAMSLAVSDDIRSRLLYKENEAHKFMNIYIAILIYIRPVSVAIHYGGRQIVQLNPIHSAFPMPSDDLYAEFAFFCGLTAKRVSLFNNL